IAAVTAADNIGVTSVSCIASGAATGNETLTFNPAGKSVSVTFSFIVSLSAAPDEAISVSCTARDTSNNASAPAGITLYPADITPPAVVIVSPTEGSTVNTGSNLVVNVEATDDLFAEEITLTATGEVAFTQTKTNASGKVFAASFALTVPITAMPGNTITLTIEAKDSTGNATQAVRTLVIGDNIAPSASVSSPGETVRYRPGEAGTAAVISDDNIGVTSISCTASGSATGNETLTFNPAGKSVSGTFSFVVSTDAPPHALINVSCTSRDVSGNSSAPASITLYVADIVPPVVAGASLADNAVDVSVNTSLTVSFNEPLAPDRVTTTSVYLVLDNGTGQSVDGSLALSTDKKIITFTPVSSLSMGTSYSLIITSAVTDEAGNPLSGGFMLRFTTIQPDTTPPSVVSVTPVNGEQGVSVGTVISVKFSEPVNPGTLTRDSYIVSSSAAAVQGAITFNQDNTAATLTPANQLSFNTTYAVTVKAGVKDTVGNATTSDYVSTFKTGGFAITSPKNNAAVLSGATLNLTAVADSGLGIQTVRFYVNNSLVGSKSGAPFTVAYTVPSFTERTDLTITAEGVTSSQTLQAPGIVLHAFTAGGDDDGDGLTNKQEIDAGIDPLTPDAFADADSDGLSNIEEIALGTSPINPDTDKDNLTDFDEVRNYKSDPLKPDTDGDGLTDGDEVSTYMTSPVNPDTDGDGLRDSWEVKYGLKPTNIDTDGDGILDSDEDPDADGLINKWEACTGLDPTKNKTDNTNLDGNHDSDRDGWININEASLYSTSPCLADTDGDGVIDPDEKNVLGTDPNNKNDIYGTDLVLSGKTIRIEGRAFFNSLTLTGNSTITALGASTTQTSLIDIEVAGELKIDATSKIDVTGKGYLGGW
ncbi:MAG: Ig-like domain-containing protein, partial [Planctomycetota bacterium]